MSSPMSVLVSIALPLLALAAPDPPPSTPAATGGAVPFRPWTRWSAPRLSPLDRVALASVAKRAEVSRLFANAGVRFPPGQLLFRVFKREGELEVWASGRASGPLAHVATYGVCAIPSAPGPKSRQGDGLVPEGFYQIDAFNAASRFYLSMEVSYPNAWDRRRSRAPDLGGAMMIHGNCVSIGCIAMSDERIQELWVAASAAHDHGVAVHVHIFPSRDMDALVREAADATDRAFWAGLKRGLDAFDRTHVLRRPGNRGGMYVF